MGISGVDMKNSKRIMTFIAPTVLVGLVSCSLVLETETSQCGGDGDCASRGAEFRGYVCNPDKVCVRAADYCETNQQCVEANNGKPFICSTETQRCIEGCAPSADGSKTATQQCIDANGQGFICKDQKCVVGCETDQQCQASNNNDPLFICRESVCVQGCRTNAQCIDRNGGEPYTCRQDTNTCVGLLTPECPLILSSPLAATDLKNDDIIYVGLMSNLGGQNSIVAMHEGAETARREFMTAGGNGLTLGKKKRPVVFVSCDNNDNKAENGLKHLINDLNIQAMVGPSNSGIFSTLGASIIQQAGRFAISGTASGVQVDPILKASNGLLYRTAPGDVKQAEAVPKYIQEILEPQVRAQASIPAGTPIRIAVAFRNDALGNGYGQYLDANIRFNGKSAADNGSDYLSVNYGDPVKDDATTFASKQAAVSAQLLAFKPHIVYIGGGPEGVKLVKPIEDGWTDVAFRPTYIYPQPVYASPALGTYINSVPEGGGAAQRDSQRRRQIGLVQTSSNPKAVVDAYRFRHLAQFPVGFEWPTLTPIPPATTPPKSTGPNATSYGYYDATYTLFYAMIATGKENPTSREIADAIVKTQPAAGVTTQLNGPDTLVGVVTELTSGRTVDINGILSDLNFVDNATLTPFAFWCLPAGAATPIESGFKYDPVTKEFSGTGPTNGIFPTCP